MSTHPKKASVTNVKPIHNMQKPSQKVTGNLRFNMHGHLIEYDRPSHTWTWSKWEYGKDWEGKNRVIRRHGTLEFMKIFPGVFPQSAPQADNSRINNLEQMEHELAKTGIDFIFLHQGETKDENNFKNIEEAEEFYGLNSYPHWNLTGFWFGFDWKIRSWAMYNTSDGQLQFTPSGAAKGLTQSRHVPRHNSADTGLGFGNRQSYSTH